MIRRDQFRSFEPIFFFLLLFFHLLFCVLLAIRLIYYRGLLFICRLAGGLFRCMCLFAGGSLIYILKSISKKPRDNEIWFHDIEKKNTKDVSFCFC